jgi:hypothetical protein
VEFVSPSVVSFLMLCSLWIPILLGVRTLIIGSFPLVFVPETLHRKPVDRSIEPVPELSDSSSGSLTMLLMKHSVFSKLKKNFDNTWDTLYIYTSMPLLLLLATSLT